MSNQEYSRVSIEVGELQSDGMLNVMTSQYATMGEIDLGWNLSSALDAEQSRPILTLAEAIVNMFDSHGYVAGIVNEPELALYAAARDVIESWDELDKQ